jgi:hypothetical protein
VCVCMLVVYVKCEFFVLSYYGFRTLNASAGLLYDHSSIPAVVDDDEDVRRNSCNHFLQLFHLNDVYLVNWMSF